jgi:hypothetical protein
MNNNPHEPMWTHAWSVASAFIVSIEQERFVPVKVVQTHVEDIHAHRI